MYMNKQLIINFCINLIALILVKITLYFLGYGEVLFDGLSLMLILILAIVFTYILDYRKTKRMESK